MDEEKINLVLKDLCARLPYGVIVNVDNGKYREDKILWTGLFNSDDLWDAKPYLRSLSSMTEEEDEWLNDRINFSREDEVGKARQKWGIVMQEIYTNSIKYDFSNFTEILDWLNSHHFDYRGLIEKGLALEAPEDMYNFNY